MTGLTIYRALIGVSIMKRGKGIEILKRSCDGIAIDGA